MDTSGHIDEHSQIKLKLYELYLEKYLSVLLVSRFQFKEIVIHDIFAGSGISDNGVEGSALIAAKVITRLLEKHRGHPTQIFLRANEKDYGRFIRLSATMQGFPFAQLFNLDANAYIENMPPVRTDHHNLFFIDPYGYTQISDTNLKKLFSITKADYLIFIPVFNIYRFLNQEENSPQYEPIAKFLNALAIGKEQAIFNVESFSQIIESALKNKIGAKFGYHEILTNRSKNNKYALFFITRHILGARLFLESQNELKDYVRSNSAQMAFDFYYESEIPHIRDFFKSINNQCNFTNCEMHENGIISGILPSQLSSQLKEMEDNNEILIKDYPGKQRQRKSFYVGPKDYKNQTHMIIISRQEN